VRVRTSDERLPAPSRAPMSDDGDVSTGDGGVVLYLPGWFRAEIDARNDGRVTPIRNQVSTEKGIAALRGRIGTGGHALKIRTATAIGLRVVGGPGAEAPRAVVPPAVRVQSPKPNCRRRGADRRSRRRPPRMRAGLAALHRLRARLPRDSADSVSRAARP
jgi:hypothetical protein